MEDHLGPGRRPLHQGQIADIAAHDLEGAPELRGEDVVLLANAFLRKTCQKQGRRLMFSSRALEAMAACPWPGNVRQLENAVQRAVIMAQGRLLEPADLTIEPAAATVARSLREARNGTERQMLVEALTRWQGNISRAARELRVSRPAIHDLLNKHHVTAAQFRRRFDAQAAGSGDEARDGAGGTK